MENSNFWQSILIARKNNKTEFDRITLERKALERSLKMVIMNVLSEALNPESKKIFINVMEKESFANVNLVCVTVSVTFSVAQEVLFWDCECDYIFNRIKETLINYGIQFAMMKYISKCKRGMLEIDLQS